MQSTDPETWKPIAGYEGFYEVSDRGNVRSLGRTDTLGRLRSGRAMKQKVTARGYRVVGLTAAGEATRFHQVHRLVLEAFVGPAPDGMVACHWDDAPGNNVLSNLRWDTASANYADAVRNGRRPGNGPEDIRVCKRGHELRDPNLIQKRDGTRRCRACNRASGYASWAGTTFASSRADLAYQEIMGAEDR